MCIETAIGRTRYYRIESGGRGIFRTQLNIYPLGKITSQGRPDDVPKKRPDIHRTYPYGPLCNTKGCICRATSLGCTQDVNLTIIHKMSFQGFFLIFPDSNGISDIVLPKFVKNLIRPILVLL